MSRRSVAVTQAEIHRALKAAQQAGPTWRVEIERGVVRITRGDAIAVIHPPLRLPDDGVASILGFVP